MDQSDKLFILAFEEGSIPKEEWTHAAHVRMSWIYLNTNPYEVARDKIRTGIKNFVRIKGLNADGYNETLTLVYIHLIEFRRKQSPSVSRTWSEFYVANPELFDRTAPLPLKYYRKETILSAEAKTRFVEPDLVSLPPLE